eukprot:1411032-Pyramimonas_sp.AAC.1
MPHDEGACWAPKVLWPATMLTHYGYTGRNQGSGYAHDNWAYNCSGPEFPRGSDAEIGEHPCFDPAKDIVVPQFK